MNNRNVHELERWIGRSEEQVDRIDAGKLRALFATLDQDQSSVNDRGIIPPLAVWTYFTTAAPWHALGPDGHPARGLFLPPVALPRRMWAGGSFTFHGDLRVGDQALRRSTIMQIHFKEGRSGPLVFVTVGHDVSVDQRVVIHETQDIVYREAPAPGAPLSTAPAAPTDAAFSRTIVPDPVLLFRYSALTFNGHRIHYDRSYATGVEGYPGLVVHGPLIATFLLELLRSEHPKARVRRFTFKSLGPLFDIHPFQVAGRQEAPGRFALWASDADGRLAMQASAEID